MSIDFMKKYFVSVMSSFGHVWFTVEDYQDADNKRTRRNFSTVWSDGVNKYLHNPLTFTFCLELCTFWIYRFMMCMIRVTVSTCCQFILTKISMFYSQDLRYLVAPHAEWKYHWLMAEVWRITRTSAKLNYYLQEIH